MTTYLKGDLQFRANTPGGDVIGDNFAGIYFGSATSSNPASIDAGAVGTCTLTVTGIATSDILCGLVPAAMADGLVVESATISSANTITISLFNPTAAPVDSAAFACTYLVIRPA